MTVDIYEHLHRRIAELEAEVERVAADDLRRLQLAVGQRRSIAEAGRARIAELEAEVAKQHDEYVEAHEQWAEDVKVYNTRIAELEAERDRLLIERVAAADLRRLQLAVGADNRRLEAEIDRLKAALAESERLIEAVPAALAAREQRARQEEREGLLLFLENLDEGMELNSIIKAIRIAKPQATK
jgi:hypothetical protein